MNTTSSLTPRSATAGTSADSPNTGEAKNLVLSSAAVDPGRRTIRVISVCVQTARFWRSDARKLSSAYRHNVKPFGNGSEADVCRQAAATADLWGVPVGVVTRVREEAVCQS
jgi:hypothetical protein